MNPYYSQRHQHGLRPPTTATEAKARNSLQPCSARGCTEHRSGLDSHCAYHTGRFKKYGHPTVKPVRRTDYRPYLPHIKAVFDVNGSHPGLVSAVDYISRWMQQAAQDESAYKGAPEVTSLVRAGITPMEVLQEVCAIWAWMQDRPRAMPTTKAEDVAISRAVIGLVPRPRRVTREAASKGLSGYALRPRFSALDSLGSHLRKVLVHLLVNVYTAVSTRDQKAQEALQALRAPLASPTAVYLAEAAAKAEQLPINPSEPTNP